VSTMSPSWAGTASCDETLNSCDAALKAKQRELDLSDLGIKIRDEDRERLAKENAQLRERGTGLFDNPFVWAALGVIAGTFIGARTTR
jgi:hypothetical protein